jgi:glycyl-tRNA synthetase beta chain
MPDLLIELRSEEIPARMQRKAAGDLRKSVTDALVDAGLTYEAAREYWTPRRLTLDIRGADATVEGHARGDQGPATKAPEQALQGFMRKAGFPTSPRPMCTPIRRRAISTSPTSPSPAVTPKRSSPT